MKIKNNKLPSKDNLKLFFFYFFISLILTFSFNGFETLSFTKTHWLFSGDDRSAHQLGWYFFKEDIWRFPLGSNPNFGDEIGNSIVYSDSIPLLALIFKSINFFLPEKFQYFSLWFILCFFLQGYLSYLLILDITKNKKTAITFSFFFLLFPPALYRIAWHPALFGQWTLILSVFLLFKKEDVKDKHWILLILLTSLIHFYFTIINLIIFNSIKLFDFLRKKIKFKRYLSTFLICHFSLFTLMYLVGYFEVRVIDTFALGFGTYKLNLLSIFDSTITHKNITWSWFLPDLELSNGEELEGFNFLGLGGILLILLGVYSFLNQRNIIKKLNINYGVWFSFIIILLLSLTNNISLGKLEILSIPLSDYLYGPLSIVRSSGRLFWIISYFTMFLSIYFISKNYKGKSFLIFSTILIIQLFDTSAGIKTYTNNIYNQDIYLKDDFWKNKEISMLKNIKTTRPVNYNKHFDKLAYFMEDNNIEKTNIIKMARVDRSKAAKNRYELAKNFNEKNLESGTIYLIDNIGHLLSLKQIFKNKNVGFFFKDNLWFMIKDKKYLMDDEDKKNLKRYKIYEPTLSQENPVNFLDKNHFVGFGWTHNSNSEGIWSEGKTSNLLFKLDKKTKNIFFEMNIIPFINERNKEMSIDVFVNGKFNNNIKFNFKEDPTTKEEKIFFKIEEALITENIINIEFRNKKTKSPFDLLISPDSRQLNFLLLNFNFFSKNI